MPARLLALDSSTDMLAVAVAGERDWLRTVPGGALASSRIIGLALEGLAACGVRMADLDAVAFAAGPGAFTGLRCACAVAQGLAFAAAKPMLAIDSLMIVAEAATRCSIGLPTARSGSRWTRAWTRSTPRTIGYEASAGTSRPRRRSIR